MTDLLVLPTDGEPVEITPRHLKNLLVRNWLTHDAMWFAGAVDELGIETANRLNRRAVAGMSAVEAARILRIMGVDEVGSGEELRRFFDVAIALVIPSAIEFTVRWEAGERAVSFEITRCFAFEGVTALGVADTYECGIYERVKGWLDALGIGYEVDPDELLCSMQHRGSCRRRFALEVPSEGSADRPHRERRRPPSPDTTRRVDPSPVTTNPLDPTTRRDIPPRAGPLAGV